MRNWKFKTLLLTFSLMLLSPCGLMAQDEEPYDEEYIVPSEAMDTSIFSIIDPSKANEVNTREVPAAAVDEFKRDDAFWYANFQPKKKEEPKKNFWTELLNSSWFKGLVWFLIIAAFIVIIITFLASSNVSLFRRASRKIRQDHSDEEEKHEDIFSIDYEKEISRALAQYNYRKAIRFQYLRTLRDLSQNNLIRYSPERTDSDYVFELAGTKFYRDFFRLTRHFEYAWYGKFAVEEPAYQLLHRDFTEFKSQIAA